MKNFIKKLFVVSITLCFCFGALFSLTACKSKNNDKKIDIVCTIFPEYDWVCEVIKDIDADINLTLLMEDGADLHNYQPSVPDLAKISKADLFIYVGGTSDKWVENALKTKTNKSMKTINLLNVIGDNALHKSHTDGSHHEDHESEEYDEHVWLSIKNAQIFVTEIANKLGEIDPSNKDSYTNNANKYNENLASIDEQYQTAVNDASVKTLVFGDRFPFQYMTNDYELKFYSAFSGCSAESEASFETITFLASKINELNLNAIIKIETSTNDIANTIKQNTINKNQKILTLNSMQGTTLDSNETYLSIMMSNLDVLKEALR